MSAGYSITTEVTRDRLAPEEAIRLFAQRQAVTRPVFDAMDAAARENAFTVARVQDDMLLNAIQTEVESALKEGSTGRDFIGKVNGIFDDAGFGRLDPWHVRLVYSQNLSNAYKAGREAQQAAVAADMPWVQVMTEGDERVRPGHAVWDGVIVRYDSAWHRLIQAVQREFGCRCVTRLLDNEDVEADGGPTSESDLANIYGQYQAHGGLALLE
jgi:uncharacterized protein with gpF-like domain